MTTGDSSTKIHVEISIISSSKLKKPLILKRQWVVFFAVSACFLMFLLRYNLSVAIISIVDEKELVIYEDYSLKDSNDLIMSNETGQVQIYRKKYPLNSFMIAQILASYFYGYSVFQLPAGRLSELFGAKWILGFGTLFSGILSFASPFMLDISPIALIICRVIIGSLQATVLSCSYTLFAEWLPNNQNVNAITLANVGFELGGISSFFFTGLICENEQYLGWRYSFYIFSLFCFIWFIPYCFLVYSKPEEDPNLSDYEKNLIIDGRMIKDKGVNQDLVNENMTKIPPKLDYKIILTSKPVIASCVAKSSIGLGYYIVTTKVPAYLHDIFKMSIKSNGSFTALMMIGSLSSKLLCFFMSSYLINLNKMSLTNLRKTFQTIAMLIPSIALFVIILNNDSQNLDIFLIVLSMFGFGFVCLGDTPITAEFAKDLSGSMFGFTNTFACLMGIVAPLLVSFSMDIYEDKATGWNCVFYVTFGYILIGMIIFDLFASALPQEWAISKFVEVDPNAIKNQSVDYLKSNQNVNSVKSTS